MAQVAEFAIDTSALSRIIRPEVSAVLEPLIESGMVATLGVLDFEDLFTARSYDEYRRLSWVRKHGYEYLPTDDKDWIRALEVQGSLAKKGRLRDVGMADLLIAAVCERHSITVLHYDADFETIAEITGQSMKWVAPRGSIS